MPTEPYDNGGLVTGVQMVTNNTGNPIHPGPGKELRLDWPEGAIACMMSREVLR
jgi:hypothetical protein